MEATAEASASVLNASVTDEVRRRVDGIARLLGVDAYVSCSVTWGRHHKDTVSVSAWPNGLCKDAGRQHFYASTFDAALTLAEAWAATYEPIRIDAIIRKLALDILDLKDQHGVVTVAMLRGRGHSQADIDAHKDAACVRAGEMSAGSPFEVVA